MKRTYFCALEKFMSTSISLSELADRKEGKNLYSYQKGAINKIFKSFEEAPEDYHLLYQLPTGGGKTVILCSLDRPLLFYKKNGYNEIQENMCTLLNVKLCPYNYKDECTYMYKNLKK